jgi:hypothetical protein
MAGSDVQVDLFLTKALSTPWKSDPANPGAALVSMAASASQSSQFAESTTLLGNAGTYTGAARTAAGAFFVVDSYSDQAGTVFVEKSADSAFTIPIPVNGVTGTVAAAGASINVKVPVTGAFYRVRYVNGAVPQTIFSLTSAFNAN